MENEIKDMLSKLLEGQSRVETEITGIKTEITGIKTEMTGMKTEITGIKTDMTGMKTEITGIKTEIIDMITQIKKNSIELETIGKNITIIAEVQTSHKEQHDFSFKNTDALIDEKTDLLGTALKSVSRDVKEAKESVDVMKDVIGRHQIDIEILKRRPV